MTPRQHETLQYINSFREQNGYSPSYDQIREALGLKSKSGVSLLLRALEDQGYIQRGYNETRSVVPVKGTPVVELAKVRKRKKKSEVRTPWG